MSYKFWCERCGHDFYTVGGDTWYKSGSVTVYPGYGYGGCCVPGAGIGFVAGGIVGGLIERLDSMQ